MHQVRDFKWAKKREIDWSIYSVPVYTGNEQASKSSDPRHDMYIVNPLVINEFCILTT
jgi:hypothetical protein